MQLLSRQLISAVLPVLLLVGCGGGSEDTDPAEPISLPGARGLVPALAVSTYNFEDDHFSGSAACGDCHNDNATGDARTMLDNDGRDLSLERAWRSSMMANAARDPYWKAVVASELALYPQHAAEINDTCTRCHAPMANEVGRRTGQPIQVFDTGSEEQGNLVKGIMSMTDADTPFNHAMDGVSCTVCHQIADDGNLGTEAGMTGGFLIEDYTGGDVAERPAYGQYAEDIDVGYMKNLAKFSPVFSAHISTSETCATCHNLKSEPFDTEGVPVPNAGHFPEQMVYSEWEASAYATGKSLETTCQGCHMPVVESAVPIASVGAGGVVRENFAEHTFLGANTVMQSMLAEWNEELGIPDDVNFEESILRNRQFLSGAAELTIQNSNINNGILNLDVKVVNNTGHKLPSGYHSRRVVMHVLVSDKDGKTIYENGRINNDGSIAGVIEDVNSHSYERHYDVITDANQVQVYQSIMGNSDNEQTHSLLNGTHYLKDNRLTPAGFNKKQVDDDIAVKGFAATQDSNFNFGEDVVSYKIPVEAGGRPYNILVELLYQPLSYGHLQALFASSDEIDAVDEFRTLYDSLEFTYETITGVVGQAQ
ncbi:MAG: cytochrome c family protein [Granulosicoccus sp.]|nr:cytochrome c family protein [Granulosicoccus sp.]